MPLRCIRDPALYQWFFFVRRHIHGSDEENKQDLLPFAAVLQEALEWVGSSLPLPPFLASPSVLPAISQRLATVPWQLKEDTLRALEARTLLDAFYLQVGQARQDRCTPADFARLARWKPKALDSERYPQLYLGEALCLSAEVDAGLSQDALRELTQEIVAGWVGQPISQRPGEGLLLPFGFFNLVPHEESEAVAVLYGPSAAPEAGRFVHAVLTQLLLSRRKAHVLADAYRRCFLRQAQTQERELDALLKEAAQWHSPLERLEHLSAAISQQQAAFIESLSTLEEQLQTLHVCNRNIELLLDDDAWSQQRQWARQLLTGDLALLMEQMETDLRYLRITQQQGDLALQSLLTVTGIRGTQWERRMTLLLGLFAVMATAQVFPELAWWWRLLLILLGGIVVGLGHWWVQRH